MTDAEGNKLQLVPMNKRMSRKAVKDNASGDVKNDESEVVWKTFRNLAESNATGETKKNMTSNNAEDSLDKDNSQNKTVKSNSTDSAPVNNGSKKIWGRKEDCGDPDQSDGCFRTACGPCWCKDKNGAEINYYSGEEPMCQELIKNVTKGTKDKVKTKNNAEDSLDEDKKNQNKTANNNETESTPVNNTSKMTYGRKEDCETPNATHICARTQCGPCHCEDKNGKKIVFFNGEEPICQEKIKESTKGSKDKVKTKNNAEDSLDEDKNSQNKTKKIKEATKGSKDKVKIKNNTEDSLDGDKGGKNKTASSNSRKSRKFKGHGYTRIVGGTVAAKNAAPWQGWFLLR